MWPEQRTMISFSFNELAKRAITVVKVSFFLCISLYTFAMMYHYIKRCEQIKEHSTIIENEVFSPKMLIVQIVIINPPIRLVAEDSWRSEPSRLAVNENHYMTRFVEWDIVKY